MFDIGWSELVVIGVVALIAIGPKELPGVLRSLGTWMGKVRRMASDFQDQFREAMREAEVADLKKQFDEASANATSAFTNPLETAQKEVEAAFATEPAASAEPAAGNVTTNDPGAVEPAPAVIEAPDTQVAAPQAQMAPAESADVKPGGGA
jgi:sec-independent protein translocase protein TatB